MFSLIPKYFKNQRWVMDHTNSATFIISNLNDQNIAKSIIKIWCNDF